MPDLRALIVEDSEDDAALLVHELERAGYRLFYEQVQTESDMDEKLTNEAWDIIFCDWSMPRFSAPEALEIAQRHGTDVPFIIISGSIADEFAVTALRTGAHDVFAKGQLTLLVPAVERELREAQIRRERSEMQAQLMMSERLASVGLLAAGVAHEINNPLSVLIGSVELARRRLGEMRDEAPDDLAVRDALDELDGAHDAAERIRDVASDLRLFARSNDEELGAVNVERVIRSSVRMAQTEIRHRARLRLDLQPVPAVEANESRLGQVILNLLVNAAQAIPEGQVEANEITVSTRLDVGDRVVVAVRDTGSGMPPEVRKHLFTPFYTTKPIGVGTGLGLSICHRIVTSIGGTISVDSAVDHGSTFRLHLRPAAVAAEKDREPVRAEPAARRRGDVLVIDDERSIGRLVEKVLAPHHDVTATTSAREALGWIEAGRRYDLILCDLMMPEVTGMDFFERLVGVDPQQARDTIFLTGGAVTARARQFLNDIDNLRIEKPFDISDLSAIVNERIS